jgi:tetratricopeptide (TPR) repeat protein
VYWFVFSYVADHFQYLASLGIIALAAAGAALVSARWRLWGRPGGYVACLVLLAILASLTWRQSQRYSDIETLFRTVIAENPNCGMAYNNLGLLLAGRGQTDEAIAEYQKALDIDPNQSEVHSNLGLALHKRGQWDDAIAHYRRALEIAPENSMAYSNLGNALIDRGQVEEAIVQYRKALEISPQAAEFHYNLARALAKQGRLDDVLAEYGKVLEIKPDHAESHNDFGIALVGCGRLDEAIAHFQKALELKPEYADVRNNLALARSQREELWKALARRRELLRSHPDNIALLNDIAWTLATNPNASVRNGAEAIELAQRAVQLSDGREPAFLGTLAAAYAEAGRFPEAAQTARKALDLAKQQNNQSLAESVKAEIPLYEAGTPLRGAKPVAPPGSAAP